MLAQISPSWEVLLYTGLLVALWMLVRFIATSMTTIWKYFGDGGDRKVVLVVDPFINGVKYAVSYWTDKGGRPYQEDRFHALKGQMGNIDASLYAVYDGHGGDKAAEYCKKHLLNAIVGKEGFQSDAAKAASEAFFRYIPFLNSLSWF